VTVALSGESGVPGTVRVRALAKINLHLEIRGRRADGYHELATVFQAIALADTLTVEASEGPFQLRCDGAGIPADATNLAWRAAAALAESLDRPLVGVAMTLDKQVPSQAGLGGGSADAAAAIRALARFWRLVPPREALLAIGRRLGADVPFFFEGGTALGTGRGDELSPLPDLPEHHVVVVRPGFGIGTAEAYAWVAESRRTGGQGLAAGPAAWPEHPEAWRPLLAGLRNDFEPVVAARHPEIADLVTGLRSAGAVAAFLSGSGSAVAGLFETGEAAARAGRALERPGTRVWVSRTVGRADYAAAVAPVG
jgi:4-diphosphocytidyl-2-C-methyl-D-erythritol kinase